MCQVTLMTQDVLFCPVFTFVSKSAGLSSDLICLVNDTLIATITLHFFLSDESGHVISIKIFVP